MIAAALLLLAAAPATPDDIHCDDPMTQLELNICAGRAFTAADAEMNAQWKITAAAMKHADSTLEKGDPRPGYFTTLLAGQRNWLAFRDQQCLLESYAMRGGSAEPMVYSGCTETLTRARTAQLQALIETGN